MHLLDFNDLTSQQINEIIQIADKLRYKQIGSLLRGKTFTLFFPESSVRTRISFEKGIKNLGGESILFSPDAMDKREQIKDIRLRSKVGKPWGAGSLS